MIEAMELALGRLDASAALPFLDKLAAEDLAPARLDNLHRQILAAVKLVDGNDRTLALLSVKRANLPLPLSGVWPFAQADDLVTALSGVQAGSRRTRVRVCLRAIDGRAIHVVFTAWAEDTHGPGDAAFGLMDITDQVDAQDAVMRLQSQIAHADRLSTLGVMTATIAHEVRQPLASMMTAAQAALRWMRRDVPDITQVEQCLETIVASAEKANETVARLHAMAANRRLVRNPCDIGVLVVETAHFLRQELASRHATLALEIPAGLPPVMADEVQIRQVITNLMVNAAQAMADAQCWSRALRVRVRATELAICVDVEDSGPGIVEKERERLFDGFFTTKSTGLGLGLRICRAIIVDHGGTLDHVSKEAAGSIFRFSIPFANNNLYAEST